MNWIHRDFSEFVATMDATDLAVYAALATAALAAVWLVLRLHVLKRRQMRQEKTWRSKTDLRSRGA